jgi:putative FmdB family regulatory protein
MPFYEYECSACKFYVEALQKISDPPIKKCPSCKKQTMKRLVSAPVFRLKGSGWYETDFKSDQDKKRNLVGEDKDTGANAETKSDTKTDSAPADKTTETKSETKAESKAGKSASKASVSKQKPTPKAKPKAKPAAKKK